MPLAFLNTNVKVLESRWFDIRLFPVLDCRGVKCSDEKRADIRRELLHRYIFIVLKLMIESSTVGFRFGTELVFPPLLMTVFDRKQERLMVSLRSAGATRDC